MTLRIPDDPLGAAFRIPVEDLLKPLAELTLDDRHTLGADLTSQPSQIEERKPLNSPQSPLIGRRSLSTREDAPDSTRRPLRDARRPFKAQRRGVVPEDRSRLVRITKGRPDLAPERELIPNRRRHDSRVTLKHLVPLVIDLRLDLRIGAVPMPDRARIEAVDTRRPELRGFEGLAPECQPITGSAVMRPDDTARIGRRHIARGIKAGDVVRRIAEQPEILTEDADGTDAGERGTRGGNALNRARALNPNGTSFDPMPESVLRGVFPRPLDLIAELRQEGAHPIESLTLRVGHIQPIAEDLTHGP